MTDDTVDFNLYVHQAMAWAAGQASRSGRLEQVQQYLDAQACESAVDGRRDKRNSALGVWLTIVPSRLNGTGISAEEWRDNVWLRYNHLPLDMPEKCDGCNCRLTMEHVLSCKRVGWCIFGMMMLQMSSGTSVELLFFLDKSNRNREFILALVVLQGKWVILRLRHQPLRIWRRCKLLESEGMLVFMASGRGDVSQSLM